jgi:hypothetical protein
VILVALVVLAAAAIVRLGGGRWSTVALLSLRYRGLVAVAVGAQILGALLAEDAGLGWCYTAGLAVSAGCALAFCVSNLRLAGVPLVALGLVCNAVVVARNGAMPVSIDAAHRAGVSTLVVATGNDPRHTIAGVGSVWRTLGDVIPFPLPGAPEVLSPGDLLVAAGLGEFVVVTARRRRVEEWRDDQPAWPQAAQALSTMAPRS